MVLTHSIGHLPLSAHSLAAAPAPSLGRTPTKASLPSLEDQKLLELKKPQTSHSDPGSGSQLTHVLGGSLFKPASPGVYGMGVHPPGKVQMGVGGSVGETAWALALAFRTWPWPLSLK